MGTLDDDDKAIFLEKKRQLDNEEFANYPEVFRHKMFFLRKIYERQCLNSSHDLSICDFSNDDNDFYRFLQYHCDRQLSDAVDYLHRHGIMLKGDIPIGVNRDSIDVREAPHLFNLDMETHPGSPFVKARPVSIKAVGGWEKENKLADKVSPRLMWLCRWIIPVLSLILVPVMLYSAMGVSFDMGRIVCSILGIMFIIIGNYLPKCRRNGVVGIKIPWTLSSDENWDKTHRLAGFVWIVCGAAAIVGGWTKPVVAIVALVAMILLPVVYSGILKHKGI